MTGRQIDIVVKSQRANVRKFVDVIQEVLLPHIDREVHLYGRSKAYERRDRSKFRIFLWSSPSNAQKKRATPSSIWGIEVDYKGKAQALYPTQGGVHIMDGEYCVASLYNGSDLHIHHNIFHLGSDNEKAIFTRVLQGVVEYFQTDSWSELCEDTFIKTLSKSGVGQELSKTQLEKQRKKFVTALRKLSVQEEVVTELIERGDAAERLEAEIRGVCNIQGVTKVELQSSQLSVYTNMIYCPHTGTGDVHAIGKFKITLTFVQGGYDTLTWYNVSKDNKYRPWGLAFPHNSGGGHACLGNAGRIIRSLLAKFEIAAAIVYAIRFIQSANIGDTYGDRLEFWPVYRTEAQIKKRKTPLPLIKPTKKVECDIKSEDFAGLFELIQAGKIKNALRYMAQLRTRAQKAQKEWVKSLRKGHKLTEEEAREEFEKIKDLKEVKQVHCYSAGVSVFTDTLYCTSRTGSVHEIGKFRIWVSFDGEIVWWNKSNHTMGRPAPFVSEDGRVLTKNIAIMFATLIGHGDIASAVTQAIRLVQSDIGDGSEVAKWPNVQKEK